MELNKIKQELLTVIDGLDIDNAYSVVKEKAILFSLFCAENYHTEFETWTRDPLPKGKVQDRKSYDIIDIGEVFKIFEETL